MGSLARALIANFEFLVIQRPFAHLTPGTTTRVIHLLAEFVSKRGVELQVRGAHQARTCLFSSVRERGLTRVCNRVYTLNDQGIRRLRGCGRTSEDARCL